MYRSAVGGSVRRALRKHRRHEVVEHVGRIGADVPKAGRRLE